MEELGLARIEWASYGVFQQSVGIEESKDGAMSFPRMLRVSQSFRDQPEEADVEGAVTRAVCESRLRVRLAAGARVAITAGSRGISGIDRMLRAAVDAVRGLGFQPFVVAAMGSHGAGTEQGQRALLAELGISAETLGCELSCSMETVALGTNSFGLPIHFDRRALQADGIVLMNRIKPHTSFTGDYESGLLKMLVVGLGKREGAAQVHKLGLLGLKRLIPEVGAQLLQSTPVALGIALLENARERLARVVAVEPEELLDAEPFLLQEARGLMGRLPFEQIDVLLVGELGKNYSGTGLDPNVIGRQRVETMPDLPRPVVTRLAVLDLSAETRGNAVGIGLADLTTKRLVDAIDPEPMRVNCYTSNFLTRARVPIALDTDREVIEACLNTCWRVHWSEARVVIIPNTLELETLWVSEALVEDVKLFSHMNITQQATVLPFDEHDTLLQEWLFPHCVRARRLARGRE